MKSTRQRNVILDIINNSHSHLDAYGVYNEAKKQISNISLGTVYRNLKTLENALLIDVVYDGTDKVRYDKSEPHQHFICTKCHKIIDIYDLNAQPEDFIHLLEPIDENSEEEVTEENTEGTAQDKEKTKEQLANGKDEKSTEINADAKNNQNPQSDTAQVQEEDTTVKHLSVRRRFGKPNKDK